MAMRLSFSIFSKTIYPAYIGKALYSLATSYLVIDLSRMRVMIPPHLLKYPSTLSIVSVSTSTNYMSFDSPYGYGVRTVKSLIAIWA